MDNDSKIRSEAKSLAQNEIGDFEFLMSIIIWFDMLSAVNLVSKHLQEKDMLIDVAIEKIKGLISYFERYRETGFVKALEVSKKIASELNIDPVFPRKCEIRRKKHFDENPSESNAPISAEESFRVNYFLCIVDQAIGSLTKRFEQYQEFEKIFGFLFTSDKLRSLDDACLESSCKHFEIVLEKHGQSDIDGNDLCVELKLLQDFLPNRKMGPLDILEFLKHYDCFPNVIIAYRILLTILVTVASAERSFSKLKLLKSYLRSTMTQERLNGLALVAIESDLLKNVDYNELIGDFVSKTVKRITLFK